MITSSLGRVALAFFFFLAVAPSAGCYAYHELGDDGGTPRDLGRDAARHDLGGPVLAGICSPGETQAVPCGHCGRSTRVCGSDGTWGDPGACAGETESCGLDVMLLADVTGSHTMVFQSSSDALQTELIVPLERDADVRVGVSAFADYPVGSYGSSTDAPFIGVLQPTHDVDAVRTAIRGIVFLDGGDIPEAEIEGLDVLSGGAPAPTARPFVCADGVPGGCWRDTAAWRVIVVMTDVASHSLPGPDGRLFEPYGADLAPPAPDWTRVRAQLIATGTYVYWIVPSSSISVLQARDQAGELARQLGEDPFEAVATYDGDTTPAISLLRERMIVHFGLHTAP